MPVAAFTERIMADLAEYGETIVTLAECEDIVHRGFCDTDAEYRARCEARARQRIYLAASRLGIKAYTEIRMDSEGPYVAGFTRKKITVTLGWRYTETTR